MVSRYYPKARKRRVSVDDREEKRVRLTSGSHVQEGSESEGEIVGVVLGLDHC